jgi:hypothetical protein
MDEPAVEIGQTEVACELIGALFQLPGLIADRPVHHEIFLTQERFVGREMQDRAAEG